jgi:hypothetical protein
LAETFNRLENPGERSETRKAYTPNFAETTECRRKNFRRISVSSAFLGGEYFFAFLQRLNL